jgi:hypothetical protein
VAAGVEITAVPGLVELPVAEEAAVGVGVVVAVEEEEVVVVVEGELHSLHTARGVRMTDFRSSGCGGGGS